MDKRAMPGLLAAAVLALAALLVATIPTGYGMTALVLLFLAAVVVFYTLARRAGRKKLIRWVSFGLCLCLALFFAAEIPVVAGARSDEAADGDFLVVMGAGINGTEPSLSMLDRLTAALDWLNAHPDADVVVTGSQAPDEIVSEASVMAVWLQAHGIAPERIIWDEAADDTRENVLNAFALAAKHGKSSVVFVSSEYHLCRIRMLIRSLGFQPQCLAARTSRPTLMVNYLIREAFAVWQIWVFGPNA